MNILLQAAPQGGNNFLLLILMFVAMFAFMIFPSMRRQRQEKNKVIMKSGLHGRITEISDTSVVIETLSGKLKFERSAVSMEYSRRISQTENK